MKMWRRNCLAGALAAIAITAISAGLYVRWLHTPPTMPETVDQALDVISSSRFARLPEYRQEAYLEESRRLFEQLPSEEKREVGRRVEQTPKLRDSVRSAMATQMMLKARQFAHADAFTRQQILDRMIGMQEMFRQQRGRRGQASSGPSGSGPEAGSDREPTGSAEQARAQRRGDRRARAQQWIEQQIESGNPQMQAYVSEFFKALRDRRIEMGLDPAPAPPGR